MATIVIAVLIMASVVFGVSAAAKVRSPVAYRLFSTSIADTGLLPGTMLRQAAAALTVAEAVIAAGAAASAGLMCAGTPGAVRAAQFALIAAIVLTATLVTGVAVVIHRGVRASCACFGASAGQPLGTIHLIRNVVLDSLLLGGLVSAGFAGTAIAVAAAALAVACGVTTALLFIRWEDLAGLLVPVTPAQNRIRSGQ
jgi:hypothetical protein